MKLCEYQIKKTCQQIKQFKEMMKSKESNTSSDFDSDSQTNSESDSDSEDVKMENGNSSFSKYSENKNRVLTHPYPLFEIKVQSLHGQVRELQDLPTESAPGWLALLSGLHLQKGNKGHVWQEADEHKELQAVINKICFDSISMGMGNDKSVSSYDSQKKRFRTSYSK